MENTMDRSPVIVAQVDEKQTRQSLQPATKPVKTASVVLLAIGALLTCCSFPMAGDLGPNAGDAEMLGAIGGLALGILSLIAGAAGLIVSKKLVSNVAVGEELMVYEDHIEGKGLRLSGGAQLKSEFYVAYDRISGVSTTDIGVSIHLKNGDMLRCVATNANEVAQAIRTRLN